MKTTTKILTKLERDVKCAAENLQRVNGLRSGIISGKPNNETERRDLQAARSRLIFALTGSGPRLKKQFGLDEWLANFTVAGTPRL